jgi:putative transposase
MPRMSVAVSGSAQAWELDDAKAEKLIRNLAQRLERDAPGVSKSIHERLDEILTVSRLGLPAEQRRSLACTHHREHDGHRASRHTQREALELPSMALRWTAAAMHEPRRAFAG